MKKHYLVLHAICMLAMFIPQIASAGSNKIIITEFMAINSNNITDEDGDHSDWIEIYNASDSTINLKGWHLTDDSLHLGKWTFPQLSFDKGAYMVIFASGKDRTDPTKNLHTNFKLSGSGEYLAITEPDSSVSYDYAPVFPAQRKDVSYGLYHGQLVYFTQPTPGSENTSGQLPFAPSFSVTRGFYSAPFDLTLSTPDGTGSIYYTLNGTRPTTTNATLYTQPIHMTTTTPVSAISVNSSGETSEIVTNTYWFIADILQQPNNPTGYPTDWKQEKSTTSIPADYAMDPNVCNSASYKNLMDESLKSIPSMNIVTNIGYLFSNVDDATNGGIYIYTGKPSGEGVHWVRPTSVEYYDPKTNQEFQLNCQLKLHGGNSRNPGNSSKHGFELAFKSAYGPSKLNFDIFPGTDATKEFNSIVLRAGYNYSWVKNNATQREMAQYIQDSWAKRTQIAMGHHGCHDKFVHLYINGLYWGMYDISEQVNNDFMNSYYSGAENDFDVIKESGITDGNSTAWNNLKNQITSATNNTNYQKIQGRNPDGSVNPAYQDLLDVGNYIDYMLVEYFVANKDWDKNNWIVGRNRVSNTDGFRFYCWDVETSMLDVNDNIVGNAGTEGNPDAFMKYLKNVPDFKIKLADHIQKNMIDSGGMLTPAENIKRYKEAADEINLAIIDESARWGDNTTGLNNGITYTRDDYWIPRKNDLLNNYFPQRTGIVLQQLKDAGLFPSVDAPEFSHRSGTYPQAIDLGMTTNEGTIYYTTDGSDPRTEITGDISTSATTYTGLVNLGSDVTINARAKSGSEWSAIATATYKFGTASGLSETLAQQLQVSNYPNPFTTSTTIRLDIPVAGKLNVDIYNMNGQLVDHVFNGNALSGINKLKWNAANITNGIYLCRINYNGQNIYLKVIKQ